MAPICSILSGQGWTRANGLVRGCKPARFLPACRSWDGARVPGTIPKGKGVSLLAVTLCHMYFLYGTIPYLDISMPKETWLQRWWDNIHPASPAASLQHPLLAPTAGPPSLPSPPPAPPCPSPTPVPDHPSPRCRARKGDISQSTGT